MQVTTLANGMRVATESTPGESVAVGVFIKSGSRFETDESNGSAHFLEHMFFKGSTNTTQSQLEKKVEQMGCRLNAYTSREQTVYYANVLKKDVGESLGILSEMLLQSTFDAAAIEREKRTILQEMEEVEKVEEEVVFDNLHYTAYQTSPLGRTILGTEENIKNMSRELIVNYIQVPLAPGFAPTLSIATFPSSHSPASASRTPPPHAMRAAAPPRIRYDASTGRWKQSGRE